MANAGGIGMTPVGIVIAVHAPDSHNGTLPFTV